MTPLGQLFLIFPFIAYTAVISTAIFFFLEPSLISLMAFIYATYGFPLTIHWLHRCFYSKIYGNFILNDSNLYCPWWGSSQIQLIYSTFPSVEGVLKLMPGAYSQWLRLWGSSIGKSVYWAPSVEILDRDLLVVGDNVIFGHKVCCSGHLIRKSKNKLKLFTKPVRIENNVLIGAYCKLGPGAFVQNGTQLAAGTNLYIGNSLFKRKDAKMGSAL